MSVPSTGKSRGMLLTIAAIAIAVGYTFGIFLPSQKAITSKRAEIREKQQFIATADRDSAMCAALEEQLASARQQVATWREAAGTQTTTAGLLGELALLAAQSNVVLNRLVPQESSELNTLRQQTLQLELVGDFHSLMHFLHAVESRPETIWISDLELQGSGEDGANVDCALSLVVFTDNRGNSG